MAGCSGYVQYEISGQVLTIGFSNPSAGKNKVGIGLTGKKVKLTLKCFEWKPGNYPSENLKNEVSTFKRLDANFTQTKPWKAKAAFQ